MVNHTRWRWPYRRCFFNIDRSDRVWTGLRDDLRRDGPRLRRRLLCQRLAVHAAKQTGRSARGRKVQLLCRAHRGASPPHAPPTERERQCGAGKAPPLASPCTAHRAGTASAGQARTPRSRGGKRCTVERSACAQNIDNAVSKRKKVATDVAADTGARFFQAISSP